MANEQINKIKKEYFVMDEYGYTDKELVDTVNELIDKVNELIAQMQYYAESEEKMVKKCLVCGNLFDTTKTCRYKYCSEKCAKSRNNNNYLRDLSTLRINEPRQVELEGDGYSDGELVYDYGECPKCGWEFEEGDKDWEEPYCCHCGQRLKWFESEDKE